MSSDDPQAGGAVSSGPGRSIILAALGVVFGDIATSPLYAVKECFSGPYGIGAVFLVVTGGEALYADLGHFGRGPIRFAWFAFTLPALLLNYFGQGAYLLRNPGDVGHPFYSLAPEPLVIPRIVLATAATIVASQAVISGAYSLNCIVNPRWAGQQDSQAKVAFDLHLLCPRVTHCHARQR